MNSGFAFDDYMSIMSTFSEYSRGMDDQQLERFDRVFATDGHWILADGTVLEGLQTIKATLSQWTAAGFWPDRYLHTVSNAEFVVGDGVVTSTSNWAFLIRRTPESGPSNQSIIWDAWQVGAVGTYEDKLRKFDDRWLFTERRIRNWEFENPPFTA